MPAPIAAMRTYWLAAILVTLLPALAGCGEKPPPPVPPTTRAEPAPAPELFPEPPADGLPPTGSCNAAGSVLRWNNGEGFTVLVASEGRQFAIQLPGKTHKIDDASAAHIRALQVDDVYYQILFVPIRDFHQGLVVPDDETLLALHAQWEFAASQRTSTPLDVFADLGNKVGATSGGRPGQPFKLWRMMSSKPPIAAQFFVTTVVDDQVVVLSAIHRDDLAAAERFKAALRHYTEALDWVTCSHGD
jgi:predicted small lipoprotein YifL